MATQRAQMRQEGWHFSCERGCMRDDYGKAGPFSVERLKRDLPFCEYVSCAYKEALRRSAGPLAVGGWERGRGGMQGEGRRREGSEGQATAGDAGGSPIGPQWKNVPSLP